MEITIDHESKTFYTDMLGIKTALYNPNPYQNGDNDPVDRGDCVVRVISKLLDISWKEAYEDMSKLGVSIGMIINNKAFLEIYLAKKGYINIGNIMCNKEYDIVTIGEFMYYNKIGKYVLLSSWHSAAYIDGVWYDNYDMITTPNAFIAEYHVAIFVDLNDAKFDKQIKERLDDLEKLSKMEHREIDKMILDELNKYKERERYVEMSTGNIYRCKNIKYTDGTSIYYLVTAFDKDYGMWQVAICTNSPLDHYNIISDKGINYYFINKYPISTMASMTFNDYNYEFVDSISGDKIKDIYKYLERIENRRYQI